jgi:hypothetical protein
MKRNGGLMPSQFGEIEKVTTAHQGKGHEREEQEKLPGVRHQFFLQYF